MQLEVVKYFRGLYTTIEEVNIDNQLKVLESYPSIFMLEYVEYIGTLVTITELEKVLWTFSKDKIPRLDGCLVEIFLHFFDLMFGEGDDLQKLVEEYRCSRKVYGALNSTFIVLIPKYKKPQSFKDYKPIYLCDLVDKLISKIIDC